MKKEESVRAMLRAAGADAGSRLMFFTADLTSDSGWAQAVAGCDYVLHVASPLSDSARKTEAEVDRSCTRRLAAGAPRRA